MQCVKCGRRAAFMCPLGTLCPTDALLVAAFHEWIPAQIRHADRLERVPAGYLNAYRIGDDPSGSPRPVIVPNGPGSQTSSPH